MSDEHAGAQAAHVSPFDAIRRMDEQGNDYWSARELAKILTYNDFRNFQDVLKKAKRACEESGQAVSDHFGDVTDMITAGKGAKRSRSDTHLSRYACYLVVQNADPEKPSVALGQTYFAVQTRRQEIADELALSALPEDQKRLIYRSEMAILNAKLADAAHKAGVVSSTDFSTFQDHGYTGLYGGLRENDIHARKGLTSPKQKILDYMGSDELIANAFRASLARQKLEREQVKDKDRANQTHHEVGREVRETIIRTGATLPENLPTPTKSIQEVQHEEQKQLEQRRQPSLFDQPSEEE